MKKFEKISIIYNDFLVKNRFDYGEIVNKLDKFIVKYPKEITDLASGTGNMAFQLHKKWPKAKINCEEPSVSMIKLLKLKHVSFKVKKNSLQKVKIHGQDLVTIAFNSINYLHEKDLKTVFRKIYSGLREEGVLCVDLITTEYSLELLGSRKSISKEKLFSEWKQISILEKNKLKHNFYFRNNLKEAHVQYIYDMNTYIKDIENVGFLILFAKKIHRGKRMLIICKKALHV